jgi:RNA polymerase sigma factor (sigma-70 family)
MKLTPPARDFVAEDLTQWAAGSFLMVMTRLFDDVVAEHGPVVMRVCRALVGPHDGQDAWSETFLAAMRAYPDLRPDSNVRAWLMTIAHRKVIDLVRKRDRAAPPADVLPDRPTWDDPPNADAELRTALDGLPPKQRGAVIYRYLADLSYADVAALLDSSEAAARRSAADGISNLRKTYLREPRDEHERTN